MPGTIETSKDGAVMFTGDATRIYQAKVIIQGLKACKIGLRLNRAYTPTNLLRTAANITGKTFKRGAYDEAIAALEAWAGDAAQYVEIEGE